MSFNHHVSDELLMAYEAGSLAEGWSLAIATHLAFCSECRVRAHAAAELGGAMLADLESQPMAEDAFDAMFARIDGAPEARPATPAETRTGNVPGPLRDYIGIDLDKVRWKRIGTAGHQAMIQTGDKETSVRLLRIPAGQPVPEHGHRGLELTVVLRGTLVDGEARFGVGEIEEANDDVQHTPCAGGR